MKFSLERLTIINHSIMTSILNGTNIYQVANIVETISNTVLPLTYTTHLYFYSWWHYMMLKYSNCWNVIYKRKSVFMLTGISAMSNNKQAKSDCLHLAANCRSRTVRIFQRFKQLSAFVQTILRIVIEKYF